jgi:hypothetical protein
MSLFLGCGSSLPHKGVDFCVSLTHKRKEMYGLGSQHESYTPDEKTQEQTEKSHWGPTGLSGSFAQKSQNGEREI